MGKGGMSAPENQDGGEENMAAWLVGLNTLRIQPFKLPPLGIIKSNPIPIIHFTSALSTTYFFISRFFTPEYITSAPFCYC